MSSHSIFLLFVTFFCHIAEFVFVRVMKAYRSKAHNAVPFPVLARFVPSFFCTYPCMCNGLTGILMPSDIQYLPKADPPPPLLSLALCPVQRYFFIFYSGSLHADGFLCAASWCNPFFCSSLDAACAWNISTLCSVRFPRHILLLSTHFLLTLYVWHRFYLSVALFVYTWVMF